MIDVSLPPAAPVPTLTERPAPSLSDLWRIAREGGPARPWTEVELGRAYYGDTYRPELRSTITAVLRAASSRFKLVRVGAQWTYRPRPESEGEVLEDSAAVTAGEIVLVQGGNAAPGLALVTRAPLNGTVKLVAEHWKGSEHPFNVVQLRPEVQREDWLERPIDEVKAALRTWHTQLEDEWVDLIALWQRNQAGPISYAEVCAASVTEAERLAWGLTFLHHGHMLFVRDGTLWRPRVAKDVFAGQEGIAHHVTLVEAGAGTRVQVGERQGTLTGRSTWQYVEVRWQDGQITQVRTRNAQLVAGLTAGPRYCL